MIYGYARVSTKKQLSDTNSLEAQRNALEKEGCSVIFEEQYTGSKMGRPEFDKLSGLLQEGDRIVATKLDRLSRSVEEGISTIRGLFDRGIKVHILNIGLLENTAMGNFFVATLLAVAELEKSLILDRMNAGREVARTKEGYREGRPLKFTETQLDYALTLLETHSCRQVAQMTQISESSINRHKAKRKAEKLKAQA